MDGTIIILIGLNNTRSYFLVVLTAKLLVHQFTLWHLSCLRMSFRFCCNITVPSELCICLVAVLSWPGCCLNQSDQSPQTSGPVLQYLRYDPREREKNKLKIIVKATLLNIIKPRKYARKVLYCVVYVSEWKARMLINHISLSSTL